MTLRSLARYIAVRKRSLFWEIDGGHRRPIRKGIKIELQIYVIYGNYVLSAQLLEVSLFGVGAVLRLERDAWSMVK